MCPRPAPPQMGMASQPGRGYMTYSTLAGTRGQGQGEQVQGAGASSWAVARGRPGGAGGPGVRGVVYQHRHQTGQAQHFTAGRADPVFTAPLHIGLSPNIIFCSGHHLPTTWPPLTYKFKLQEFVSLLRETIFMERISEKYWHHLTALVIMRSFGRG